MSPVDNAKDSVNHSDQAGVTIWARLRKQIVPLLTLLLAIGITVVLFLYRDRVAVLGNFAYLSAFLISLVANATVILPMPGLAILMGLGVTFNPVLVGLAGAVGGAIGEMTGYMIGYSGRGVVSNRRAYARAEGWMGKRRGFLVVFLFALLPILPLDVAGMVAGILRYPVWKFLLASFLGKGVLYVALIYTGAWGWEMLSRFFG
jgi:membrane protein YqaA with SNARE-associated domain